MEEKQKRGEKAKNKAKRGESSSPFVGVAIFLALLIMVGAGMMAYVLLSPSTEEEPQYWTTTTAIVATNQMALTQISASETAAVENATATAYDATRRVELRLTTTAHVQLTETSQAMTEAVTATAEANVQATQTANAIIAATLAPIVSQTAEIEGMRATERVREGSRATATALALLFNPTVSPTAGNCGFAIYSGLVESTHASEAWRMSLDAAGVSYSSARALYDAFEAMNNCQGGLVPLPYQCQILEISINITENDYVIDERRVSRLYPIIESMQTASVCNGADVELRVYFFLTQADFRYWAINRETALEAYRSGADAVSLWALGTTSEE